jgi:hypothetical protein
MAEADQGRPGRRTRPWDRPRRGSRIASAGLRAEVSARVASLRSRDSGNGGDPAFQPDVFWLFDQQAEIAGFLPDKDPTLIYGLVELIVNPSRYRTRTVETVSLDQRRIKQRVSIEYTLPEGMSRSNSQFAYLPILPARKGELVDGFSISDASGMTLPDLAYNETVRLVSVASWFGFVGDTESVLRTSLAARLCLINTGILSIVASAIYLLRVPNPAGSREFGLIGIHDPFWIALFVLASVNLFYVTSRYFVRTAFYDALLQRGDPDSGHGVR